jgi:hypothetical protein
MKKIALFSLILFGTLILVSNKAVRAGISTSTDIPAVADVVDGGKLGSRIEIAVSSVVDEMDPAVAVCGDVYLVVYERDGDIYGQRLNLSGELVGGSIEIFSGSFDSTQPDVACLWPGIFEQYFVVVWTYDYQNNHTDYDVYARSLTSGGSLVETSSLPVAITGDRELNPTLACEVDDYYCLVVYEYAGSGFQDIQGLRLHMTNFGLELHGDKFDPGSDTDVDVDPDLTWSMTRGEYLLAWSYFYDALPMNYFRVVYTQIYEDEQGNGVPEVKHSPNWLIAPGTGYDTSQTNAAVAFNNLSGNYIFTFNQTSPMNAVVVLNNGASLVGSPFVIEQDVYNDVAVAYSGGPTGALNAIDEFMVVTPELGPSGYSLEGTYVWKNSQGATDFEIGFSPDPNIINNPDMTGNPNDGTYLVVWQRANASGYDVFGQRYGNGVYNPVYFPLVIK